ncbi:MAG: PQQ-binding-like beta-propeller repeat protein [Verrucomicrobia bacterium]|nr:PQQ-binding-like beta-propeller repeat protein [Verrucomicrobiota bacterium]
MLRSELPRLGLRLLSLAGTILAMVSFGRECLAQQLGEKLWEFNAGMIITQPPAIATDGTIYFTTSAPFGQNNKIYALNPDGSKKWEVTGTAQSALSPTLGSDGTIYIASGANLHAYNSDGTRRWTSAALGGLTRTTPSLGPDGTVYVGANDRKLYAVNPDGTQKWAFDIGQFLPRISLFDFSYPPAIGRDGTIYFGIQDFMFFNGFFFAVNPDGTVQWQVFVGFSVFGPAIDEDGTLYFGLSNGTLQAFNADGTKKWEFVAGGSLFNIGPLIGPDGTIYVVSNKLSAVNPDGTKKWEFSTPALIRTVPAIDQEGALYFSSSDDRFYCLNNDGTQRWVFKPSLPPPPFVSGNTTANIGPNGTVYLGHGNGFLYALRGGQPPATSPWPMFGHDPQHTGMAGGNVTLRITSQPKDLSVVEGDAAEFSVAADGEAPLSYQWRFNGQDLPGATGPVLSLRLVVLAHSGAYQVVVRNRVGFVLSRQALLTIAPGAPFVERQLPDDIFPGTKLKVTLSAQPHSGAISYAVEEEPPPGWVVDSVQGGGSYDVASHKVKFGPYFDSNPRELSYHVVPPVLIQSEVASFGGHGSVRGVDSPITGDTLVRFERVLHPADLRPADSGFGPPDFRLSVAEVTDYGTAWLRGETWPVPPNPIPIDYVTRAAALWVGGEIYAFDASVQDEAKRWVNRTKQQSTSLQSLARTATSGAAPGQNIVIRQTPGVFVPSEPFRVTLRVTPEAGIRAYAVLDQPPAGWSVTEVNSGGHADAIHRQVRWGPFFDQQPRELSYVVMPLAAATGHAEFAGVGSFDGGSVAIAGAGKLPASSRLLFTPQKPGGPLELRLLGEANAVYEIEVSEDLRNWTKLSVITNRTGAVQFNDPENAGRSAQRFYRAIKPGREP